ncbi:MAG: hypothetical protein BMS9Abin13_572 [Patescibacteria group bacterium]|nr:MAG: hypothetical protein BMS9Abin13_572 [Patescibacteria group bacterium]
MIQKTNLKIEGMHCGACSTGIEMLLSNKEGVSSVKVDYDKKMGEVEFDDDKVSLDALLTEIGELGYTATSK